MNITKQSLEEIIRHAKRFYLEDNAYICDLDEKQFMAQCYLKACLVFLNDTRPMFFPKREDTTGFGDSDG